MASAALCLDSFLDLPLPVHSKFPTVTVVSKVLWWGGPSPLDHSNSGLCIPFLTTSSCRWLMGLLCGARPDVVHWFNKVNIKLRFFELIQCHPGCLMLGLVFFHTLIPELWYLPQYNTLQTFSYGLVPYSQQSQNYTPTPFSRWVSSAQWLIS